MLKVDDFSTRVSARILEFFSDKRPWFRGLWNTGFSMALAEVLEGSGAVRRKVLGKDAFRELIQTTRKYLAWDYSLPLPEQKNLVHKCLSGDLLFESRGNFNAFRGRIPNAFTRSNFNGTWISAADGDRDSELLKVGKLPSHDFVGALRNFVVEAGRLKSAYKRSV